LLLFLGKNISNFSHFGFKIGCPFWKNSPSLLDF
jgi:hypothetical protein